MTQEQNDLLLRDLCARLPYKVKVQDIYYNSLEPAPIWLIAINAQNVRMFADEGYQSIEYIKPYLFPLSSMTEEQKEELDKYFDVDSKFLIDGYKNGLRCPHPYFNVQDWYNKNHFDYRGLIPMGLAIDATGKNIY